MANLDAPHGGRPYGVIRRVQVYVAGNVIRPGDFVHMEADGKVDVATASESLLGVSASGAADGESVAIYDDSGQEFILQADESDVNVQTDIGLNYNLLATAGDSTFRISRHELDSSTGLTDSTLPLHLLRIDARSDNALGAQVDCIVRINVHQLNNAGREGL